MSHREEDLIFDPQQFCGRVRLFPLPNLVLYPHVIQPLRVFEPRYVDMLEDALSTDRLIAMSLLKPGWEQDYEGRPPIAPVACLGRVLTWQSLPTAQYNLLLVGLRRVRIVRELPSLRTFREAQVEVLEDEYPCAGNDGRQRLQRKLVSAFEKMLPCIDDAAELLDQVSTKNIALGTLTDVISYGLEMDLCAKQSLLAELDVDKRARSLLANLKEMLRDTPKRGVEAAFPPAFSAN